MKQTRQKKGRPQGSESKPDPTPSLALQEPYMRLAAAIVANAIRDLKGRDPVRALDAFIWLASDGLLVLQALGGFDQVDSLYLLEVIATGRIYATKKDYSPLSGSITRRAAGDEPGRADAIPGGAGKELARVY